MRATNKCCLQVCRRAYCKYMEQLKTKLSKKGTSDREFWQITKSHSGMTIDSGRKLPPLLKTWQNTSLRR